MQCCHLIFVGSNVIIFIMQRLKLSEIGISNVNNIPLNVIELTKMYPEIRGLGIVFPSDLQL